MSEAELLHADRRRDMVSFHCMVIYSPERSSKAAPIRLSRSRLSFAHTRKLMAIPNLCSTVGGEKQLAAYSEGLVLVVAAGTILGALPRWTLFNIKPLGSFSDGQNCQTSCLSADPKAVDGGSYANVDHPNYLPTCFDCSSRMPRA